MNPKHYRLPIPQGKLTTGCTDLLFEKTSKGTLMRLFYPTEMKNIEDYRDKWASWFLGNEYNRGLAKFAFPSMVSLVSYLLNLETKCAKIPSIWEAPLAKGKYPLVIFSHGLSAHRTMYSTICNDLASHGFIVASIEHRDESASATFTLSDEEEKEWIYYKTLKKNVKEYPLRHNQVKIRAEECIRTLDKFHKLQNGEILKNELSSSFNVDSLRDAIDLSKVAIAGHSFGGITSMLALSKDKRFKIGLALDPWMFPLKDDLEEFKKTITQPVLTILTETFQNQPNYKAFTKVDSDNFTFVTLKGSVHQNQADTPFLFSYIGKLIGRALSKIDERLAMSLNNQLMIHFICSHFGLENSNKEVSLEAAQKHLQIGLDLSPVSAEKAQQLLSDCVKGNGFTNNVATSKL